MTHSPNEIKNEIFDLKSNGVYGPGGFGDFFFQKYWDIFNNDVIRDVIEFYTKGWLLPNYNANTLILMPKHFTEDTIDQDQ